MNNTYSCRCPKYMELDGDGHTCKATNKQKFLLMGFGKRLVRLHNLLGRQNDGKSETIDFNFHRVTFNSISNDVIGFDNTEKVIFTFNLDSRSVKKIISQNLGYVTALTFGKSLQPHSLFMRGLLCAHSTLNRSFGEQPVLDRLGARHSRSIFIQHSATCSCPSFR